MPAPRRRRHGEQDRAYTKDWLARLRALVAEREAFDAWAPDLTDANAQALDILDASISSGLRAVARTGL
jgi:hypothetical protein